MPLPVVVDFPLRGEWITPNTPGTKVPSHGTDLLGERYAFDFVGVDPQRKSARFYRPSPIHYFVLGVRLQDCFGWGQPIYSSTAGVVVQAEDGWPERNPVHLARDFHILLKKEDIAYIGFIDCLIFLLGNIAARSLSTTASNDELWVGNK